MSAYVNRGYYVTHTSNSKKEHINVLICTSRFSSTHGSIFVVSLYVPFSIRVETHSIRLYLGFSQLVPGDRYGIDSANVGVAQFSLTVLSLVGRVFMLSGRAKNHATLL